MALLKVAEGYDLNTMHLLQQAEISRDWLRLPFNKVPLECLVRAFDVLYRQTGDDDLGILVGRAVALGNIHTLIHLSNISRNIRDFLKHVPSTDKLLGDVGATTTKHLGNLVRAGWAPVAGSQKSERFLADMVMSFYKRHFDSLTAKPIPIKACHFRYQRPRNVETLNQVFGYNLFFEQPDDCFFFDAAALDYPIIQLNDELLAEQPLESLFGETKRADPFMSEVYDCISRLLPSESLSMELVANELGMSKRTFQRRLGEKQAMFKTVLLEVRERQAKRYLLDSNLSMTEVAFLLGYKNSANFSTAFKGWLDITPTEYRERSRRANTN